MKFWFSKLVLLLAISCASGPAAAQTWKTVSSTASSTVELDYSSIKIDGSIVRSWIKSTLTDKIRVPGTLKYYKYTVNLQVTDCKKETYYFEKATGSM
jgi:hypothetical protein